MFSVNPMKLLTALPICQAIYKDIMANPLELRQKIHLAVILVGNDQRSLRFIQHKKNKATELGYRFTLIQLPKESSQADIINEITQLNHNPEVTGIILQLPLPSAMNTWKVTEHIDPKKDVDCLTPQRMGAFTTGVGTIYPGTAKAIELMCQYYQIEIQGKRVLVLGDSNLVGKPAALWCLKNNATITVCNKYTPCLEKSTKESNIIISATGKRGLIHTDWLNDQHIIFDIGIHIHDNKISGDIDCEINRTKVKKITPVPGGIGPLTVAVLMDHLLKLKFGT
jgi:methylenetetrahydrofolate dehydrogenase (NADP+)/methenyltetrahydrofolate cyclohydrolase